MATIICMGKEFQTSGLRYTAFGLEIVTKLSDEEFSDVENISPRFLGRCVLSVKDKAFANDEAKREFIEEQANQFFNTSTMDITSQLVTVSLVNNVIVVE